VGRIGGSLVGGHGDEHGLDVAEFYLVRRNIFLSPPLVAGGGLVWSCGRDANHGLVAALRRGQSCGVARVGFSETGRARLGVCAANRGLRPRTKFGYSVPSVALAGSRDA